MSFGLYFGLGLILFFTLLALGAPWIAPYSPHEIIEGAHLLKPGNWQNHFFAFGTDDIGRDLLSRIVFGARVSLIVGGAVVMLSSSLGTVLGLGAGFLGGWVDRLVMRLMDLILALPSILFAIVIVAVMGPGLTNAILAVSIVVLPNFVRLIRAQTLVEKEKSYVQSAKLIGASKIKIMYSEILPNCAAPLIVQASLSFSEGVLNTAALGFLGLGAQPPTPEWGTMLADARSFIESSPWLVTLPGLCILLVVLAFNILGDSLRDALDPRLRTSALHPTSQEQMSGSQS